MAMVSASVRILFVCCAIFLGILAYCRKIQKPLPPFHQMKVFYSYLFENYIILFLSFYDFIYYSVTAVPDHSFEKKISKKTTGQKICISLRVGVYSYRRRRIVGKYVVQQNKIHEKEKPLPLPKQKSFSFSFRKKVRPRQWEAWVETIGIYRKKEREKMCHP